LTPPTGSATIASRIQDGSYDSLQALDRDVEDISTELLAASGGKDSANGTTSPPDTALQAQVLAFRKVAKSLVDRESARNAQPQSKLPEADNEEHVSKTDGTPVPTNEEEQDLPQSRTVITLFGSANGVPKQLFSSLQQSRKVAPSASAPTTFDTSVQVTLPLRESSLPNIMSTTEV
jgi:hypothetical protein